MKTVPELLDKYGWKTMPNGNRRSEKDEWIYDWEKSSGSISTLWRWPVKDHNTYDLEQFIISTNEKAIAILEATERGDHLPRIEVNPATLNRILVVE